MTQHYSAIERACNEYTLPDLETFYRTREENAADSWYDETTGETTESGWFFWYCFPGCLPEDSNAAGPFETEQAALDYAMFATVSRLH